MRVLWKKFKTVASIEFVMLSQADEAGPSGNLVCQRAWLSEKRKCDYEEEGAPSMAEFCAELVDPKPYSLSENPARPDHYVIVRVTHVNYATPWFGRMRWEPTGAPEIWIHPDFAPAVSAYDVLCAQMQLLRGVAGPEADQEREDIRALRGELLRLTGQAVFDRVARARQAAKDQRRIQAAEAAAVQAAQELVGALTVTVRQTDLAAARHQALGAINDMRGSLEAPNGLPALPH